MSVTATCRSWETGNPWTGTGTEVRCDGGRDRFGDESDPNGASASTVTADGPWAALEGVVEPVVEYEFDGDTPLVRRVNDAFARTFGVSPAQVGGTHLADVLDVPADADAVEFERGFHDGEVTRRTPAGRREFHLRIVPIDDGRRQIATYSDRTLEREYDRKVEALHESTRRLIQQDSKDAVARTAVNAAVQILELDATSVHFVDGERERLTSAATTERTRALIGDPPPLPIDDSLAGTVFTTGDPIVYEDPSEYPGVYNPDTAIESEIILPLGDHGILLSGSSEPSAFSDADVSLMTILASNTAAALDRIEREETLARRERELERKNERLEKFASMVSHDLRNPLTVAMGRLELIADDAETEHVDALDDALDRMEALIHDLLELARHGDDIGDVIPVEVDEVARDAWRQVETGEATLDVTDVGEIPADVQRLAACFENLFRNAIEHGDTDVSVRVGRTDEGFFVADDGPGVPPAERERVFDVGYSKSADGTGLGLAIVEEIAVAHGWEVRLTESADGGARFEFVVPDRADD